MAKKFSKCPPLVGDVLKELYRRLEDVDVDVEHLIDSEVLASLKIISEKKGAPIMFLTGQLFPAVSSLMGDAYICAHDV